MTNVLAYQDYRAEFGFDADADLFHGRVIGINAVVDFCGKDIEELNGNSRPRLRTMSITAAPWARSGRRPGRAS